MELTFDKSTHIGLGYAKHADAFQCGREAAQMAKNQLPDSEADLVLVFCPTGIHFKDFIEGVRLVTGENKLIGIPVDWALANDLPSVGSCVVLVAQLPSVTFTITSTQDSKANLEVSLTSLISQCRQLRGSARHLFEHHGLLILENKDRDQIDNIAKRIVANLDFETWVAGLIPSGRNNNPIVCRNQIFTSGLVALEFFSNTPMGVGSVGLTEFTNQIEVYREAAKSAVRDALTQMEDKNVAFGLLFVQPPVETWPADEWWGIFRSATSLTHNVPFVMLPTTSQFSRSAARSTVIQKPSVLALLVPK